MAAKVNYSDNLFYLSASTRLLRSALQLGLDADYFHDKLVEDLFFIDRTLLQMGEALQANVYLIDRDEHLKELMRTKRAFADLIDDAVNGRLALSSRLEPFSVRLRACREEHVGGISDLQASLEARTRSTEPDQAISEDEYRFLLQNDATEDDS